MGGGSSFRNASPIYPPTYDPFLVLTLENGSVTYDFRTSVQSIDKGLLSWIKVKAQLDSLLPYSGFELCPEYPATVHFESRHYVHITTPYDCHQSDACSVWHIPKNRQQVYGGPPCKVLYNQLETIRKRHENYSPGKREAWKLPSCKRPLKYCSPNTGMILHVMLSVGEMGEHTHMNVHLLTLVKQRHNNVQQERKAALKCLKKYDKLDFSLNCAQHDEFMEAVSVITEKCPQHIKQVLSEADARGKGEIMRRLWKNDVEDRLAFTKDQTNSGNIQMIF